MDSKLEPHFAARSRSRCRICGKARLPGKRLSRMFWYGKRVLLTGHTGFKGSWLSLWLQRLGAEVVGYALDPPTNPNLFHTAQVSAGMKSIMGDVRDLETLRSAVHEFKPEVVFHLAAQPLVRHSYAAPLETYSTNVMGTANVLDVLREIDSVRAVVVITTDKCYANREWEWPYREIDELGGYDPYSNSKACAELVVSAYRNSFFQPDKYDVHGVALASARAGNVIGGGDWAADRLVPDIVRALAAEQRLKIRNPLSVRPWQHVLEPLRGYLKLAECLYIDGPQYGEAWNFGPEYSDIQPVQWIVEHLMESWGAEPCWEGDATEHPHEAQMLRLDWSKAAANLGWRPRLGLSAALELTAQWYKAWIQGQDMKAVTLEQIDSYCRSMEVPGSFALAKAGK